jgi:hypothetical protein
VRRTGAHWLVLAAVLITVLVSAALADSLAVFAGQAMPQTVHRELATASGTSVLISGPLTETAESAAVHAAMRSAFGAVPFAFYGATWSDSLGLPASAGAGKLVKAVAAEAVAAHSVLTSGRWPGAPRSRTANPRRARIGRSEPAAPVGGGSSRADRRGQAGADQADRYLPPRDPASAYWQLDPVGVNGFTVSGRFTSYGPLIVSPAAFGGTPAPAGTLTAVSAAWVAEPDTADVPDGDLSPLAGRITQDSSSYWTRPPSAVCT